MKKRIIRWLLRMLGEQESIYPELAVYVLVEYGQRVAGVTANKNRAVAIAREAKANGRRIRLWRYEAIRREQFE